MAEKYFIQFIDIKYLKSFFELLNDPNSILFNCHYEITDDNITCYHKSVHYTFNNTDELNIVLCMMHDKTHLFSLFLMMYK